MVAEEEAPHRRNGVAERTEDDADDREEAPPQRRRAAYFVPPGATPQRSAASKPKDRGAHNSEEENTPPDDADDDDDDDDGSRNNDDSTTRYGRPRNRRFGDEFEPHFAVPSRLADTPAELVEAVNDFHYAMMNDHPRNEFYRACLERAIVPGESIVLEIGTGSGLLAMLAASLGAKRVVALEASKSLAELARRNVAENETRFRRGVVQVVEKLSTDATRDDILSAVRAGRGTDDDDDRDATASDDQLLPDVVVSELFGTLLLGESALEYLRDALARLARPGARVVPPRGVQYAALVECPDIAAITSARDWGGFSLRHANVLQDTASVVFTKQYGFRFSSVASALLAPPVPVFEVDFNGGGATTIGGGSSRKRDRADESADDAETAESASSFDAAGGPALLFAAPAASEDDRAAAAAAAEGGGDDNDGDDHHPRARRLRLVAERSGVAHCVLVFWDVTIGVPRFDGTPPAAWERPDDPRIMSTDPERTRDNFARDMQWGQGIQLLEDLDAARDAAARDLHGALTRPPTPLRVTTGDDLALHVTFSSDSVVLQFELRNLAARRDPPGGGVK